MKTTTILAAAVAAFLPAADAWQIILKGTDGRQGTLHGTVSTGCINLNYSPVLNVREAVFASSLGGSAYTLYSGAGCTGASTGKLRASRNLGSMAVRSYNVDFS